MADLPFQAEYAKSGRAACKGCKEKIEQGTLRIAVMVQSAFHDGKQPNWHHEECFFKKRRVQSIADIGNFNRLRTEDKNRIKETIVNNTGVALPVEKGKGRKKKAANNNAALKDFVVEYSKSSRATCRLCDIKICKDEVRICKIVFDTEVGMKYGGQPLWHHVKCFAIDRDNLGYLASGEDMPGFKLLSKEDQNMVKNELPPKSLDEVPIKKLKLEPKDGVDMKVEKELEKQIEKQSKLFFKYKDQLEDFSKNDLHELLRVNSQQIPSGISECQDRVADCMAFGALKPCPECGGQLVLDTFNYKCTGEASEWSKCRYTTREPERKKLKVPKEYKDLPAFKKYKAAIAVRAFEVAPPPQLIIKKEEPQEKKNIPIPPLKNLQFFLCGRLKNKTETKNRILKMGGLVTSKLTDSLAAVVASKSSVENMAAKIDEVEELDIEVVEEAFFDNIDKDKGTVAETLELIKQHNIAPWGGDPTKRVPQDVIDGKSIPKSGSMYVKSSKSTTTKLKIKGGSAVDPDSGLEDVAHVYTDPDGNKYTIALSKADIVEKKNSYYKLQLLQADNKNRYWVFRSWGRIGTTIGGNKLEEMSSLDKAKRAFESLYMEKTQSAWEDRHNFVRAGPNVYYPIDVEYGDAEAAEAPLTVDKSCRLPVPVQILIARIFDVNVMKKTLLEFDLDTEKMPLGKLSKKQIKDGYNVLNDLLKLIQNQKSSENKVIEATNRFYTLIPHDFGMENPPPLDDVEEIKKKIEMLDNLLEIEIAYSLLKTDTDDTVSPIESHYLKLKCELAPVAQQSPHYQMVLEYITNTHAATHSNYKLEIQQLFEVAREGEGKRYKPFKKLHNRRLLWHGSRVTNFAGILSQGLRIAPPEAPVTGYMFGKGIYFADMVSKSANYCWANTSNPVGVLLLCEVALGDMYECTKAEMITKPPGGKHSTWGKGRTQPEPAAARTLPCGTLVPLGPPTTDDNMKTSLLYNEFIVYDVAQVNIRYLMEVKFVF